MYNCLELVETSCFKLVETSYLKLVETSYLKLVETSSLKLVETNCFKLVETSYLKCIKNAKPISKETKYSSSIIVKRGQKLHGKRRVIEDALNCNDYS
ncbi:hypothetical protein J6590_020470 [Homalodisca vitripennis]|nr:hypothetical protein J6590_020470 [Homalodisca vitripennis]